MDPEGEPRWKRWAEGLRLWAPLVVSFCAISLTVFQAMAARRHNRLSVQPKLDFRIFHEDSGEVALKLVNVGFGPAIVTDIVMLYDDAPVGPTATATCDKVDTLLGRSGDRWDTACFVFEGEYHLRPGDEFLLYGSRPAPGTVAGLQSAEDADALKLSVNARYCSFYEDCWWLSPP